MVPFPNWEMNSLIRVDLKAFNQFISVTRLKVDPCDRLWILDEGTVDLTRDLNITVYRKPSLFVYDLKKDKIVRFHEFLNKEVNAFSIHQELVVDVTKEACENAFVYVSDFITPTMLVYSLAEHTSWAFNHSFFHLNPFETNLKIAGMQFQWYDGVDGLALSGVYSDGYRKMYFQTICGAHLFSVSTKVLQNSNWMKTKPEFYHQFSVEGRMGNYTQAVSMVLDEVTGVIFNTQINRNGIACWNTNKPLHPFNFPLLAKDPHALVFPNDVKVNLMYILAIFFIFDFL